MSLEPVWVNKPGSSLFLSPHVLRVKPPAVIAQWQNLVQLQTVDGVVHTTPLYVAHESDRQLTRAWLEYLGKHQICVTLVDEADAFVPVEHFVTYNQAGQPCFAPPQLAYGSPHGQDAYFVEEIQRFRTEGTYLDVRYHDPEEESEDPTTRPDPTTITQAHSHTAVLHHTLGWQGLCVNTHQKECGYTQQTRSTRCDVIHMASHVDRVQEAESDSAQASSNLQVILERSHRSAFDYVYLDVAGQEMTLLQSLDWQNLHMPYLVMKHRDPTSRTPVRIFLAQHHYVVERCHEDEVAYRRMPGGATDTSYASSGMSQIIQPIATTREDTQVGDTHGEATHGEHPPTSPPTTRVAVVTANFGGYDSLKEPQGPHEGVDFFYFTDQIPADPNQPRPPSRWHIVTTPYHQEFAPLPGAHFAPSDERPQVRSMMRAKFFKTQAHRLDLLQRYTHILWLDASFQLRDVRIQDYVDTELQHQPCAMFRHSARGQIYDEAIYVMQHMDSPYLYSRYHELNMAAQILDYALKGFDIMRPDSLWEMGCFILARGHPAMQACMNQWWRENQWHGFQDQLSLPYCLWQHQIQPCMVSRNIFTQNPWATHQGHTPSKPPSSQLQGVSNPEQVNEQVLTDDTCRSFDCFDTLVIRPYVDPQRLLVYMEQVLKIPGFRDQRIQAQQRSAHFQPIYTRLQPWLEAHTPHLSIPQQATYWKTLEYLWECATLSSHRDLSQHVRSSDLVVADTHWTPDQIRTLLKSVGIRFREVYATPRGKISGAIWPRILRKHQVQLHVGDEEHNDIIQAQSWVQTRHYTGTRETPWETDLARRGWVTLAGICRQARLGLSLSSTPHNPHLFQTYTQVNLPILFLLCEWVYRICQTEPVTRVAFLSRGTYQLHQLFIHLYPEIDSRYVWFSRHAAQHGGSTWRNAMRRDIHSETLVIDLYACDTSFPDFATDAPIPYYRYLSCVGGVGWNPAAARDARVPSLPTAPPDFSPSSSSDSSRVIPGLHFSPHGAFLDLTPEGGTLHQPLESPSHDTIPYLHVFHEWLNRTMTFQQRHWRARDREPEEPLETMLAAVISTYRDRGGDSSMADAHTGHGLFQHDSQPSGDILPVRRPRHMVRGVAEGFLYCVSDPPPHGVHNPHPTTHTTQRVPLQQPVLHQLLHVKPTDRRPLPPLHHTKVSMSSDRDLSLSSAIATQAATITGPTQTHIAFEATRVEDKTTRVKQLQIQGLNHSTPALCTAWWMVFIYVLIGLITLMMAMRAYNVYGSVSKGNGSATTYKRV